MPFLPVPSFHFSAEEIEKLAEIEHRRWIADRRLEGWSYGPTRDSKLKHHPMLIEWESLPDEEREKNRDFVRESPQSSNLQDSQSTELSGIAHRCVSDVSSSGERLSNNTYRRFPSGVLSQDNIWPN